MALIGPGLLQKPKGRKPEDCTTCLILMRYTMSLIGGDKPQKLIIDITDIYEQRDRKEKELEFYQEELEKLMMKMGMLQHEIGVTETIIRLIENEQVLDLQNAIKEKRRLR